MFSNKISGASVGNQCVIVRCTAKQKNWESAINITCIVRIPQTFVLNKFTAWIKLLFLLGKSIDKASCQTQIRHVFLWNVRYFVDNQHFIITGTATKNSGNQPSIEQLRPSVFCYLSMPLSIAFLISMTAFLAANFLNKLER